MHGAPFQWAAIFHKTDLAFDRGVDGLAFYNSGSKKTNHDLPCKVSCGHCRSRIIDEGRNMVLLFPGLLHFDEEEKREKFDVHTDKMSSHASAKSPTLGSSASSKQPVKSLAEELEGAPIAVNSDDEVTLKKETYKKLQNRVKKGDEDIAKI
ncbi:hypothetical protein K456DRAFT_1728592 [Colletotrichum gloeosporioides 23]|nr:hypothetical protein K456DRAFT_1728592 [Colletotrichum gloeosporioides 23]